MSKITRRRFLKVAGSSTAVGVLGVGFPTVVTAATHKLVVIGGGSAGAIAAKYVKKGDPKIEVTLIEENDHYYTCMMSNEVLGGNRTMDSIKFSYKALIDKYGIHVLHDHASGIDPVAKKVMTKGGKSFHYDKLVVAPGIDFKWDAIANYDEAASHIMPHAWKPGSQTAKLREQLVAMPDGGVVLIAPPANPFRCPPGPYERACQIAWYLKNHKPKSKILILDAKDKFSKQKLFEQGWKDNYHGMIDWIKAADTAGGVKAVDPKRMTAMTEFDSYKVAVANIIPPQKAAKIARIGGLTNASEWCPVHLDTFESTLHKDVHVIGDASIAKGLPKTGYAANSEAKVCALAILTSFHGKPMVHPAYVNTCYSIVAPHYGISRVAVYKLADDKSTIQKLSGGLTPVDASADVRNREYHYAHSGFKNIAEDMFA